MPCSMSLATALRHASPRRPAPHPEAAQPTSDPASLASPGSDLAARWEAIEAAGAALAGLAGLGDEARPAAFDPLPALATGTHPNRARLLAHAIGDLSAMLETGLRALVGAADAGADPAAAAHSLWHEYAAARAALVALCHGPGAPAAAG